MHKWVIDYCSTLMHRGNGFLDLDNASTGMEIDVTKEYPLEKQVLTQAGLAPLRRSGHPTVELANGYYTQTKHIGQDECFRLALANAAGDDFFAGGLEAIRAAYTLGPAMYPTMTQIADHAAKHTPLEMLACKSSDKGKRKTIPGTEEKLPDLYGNLQAVLMQKKHMFMIETVWPGKPLKHVLLYDAERKYLCMGRCGKDLDRKQTTLQVSDEDCYDPHLRLEQDFKFDFTVESVYIVLVKTKRLGEVPLAALCDAKLRAEKDLKRKAHVLEGDKAHELAEAGGPMNMDVSVSPGSSFATSATAFKMAIDGKMESFEHGPAHLPAELSLENYPETYTEVFNAGDTYGSANSAPMRLLGATIGPSNGKYLFPKPGGTNGILPRLLVGSRSSTTGAAVLQEPWMVALAEELWAHNIAYAERSDLAMLASMKEAMEIIPSELLIGNTGFCTLAAIGDLADNHNHKHKDGNDVTSCFVTLGHGVSGGSTVYYNGPDATNAGDLIHTVPLQHGRFQTGAFHHVLHATTPWTGPRATLSFFLRRDLLDHFKQYGHETYYANRARMYQRKRGNWDDLLGSDEEPTSVQWS